MPVATVKDPASTQNRTQGGATPDVAKGGREPGGDAPETPLGESADSQRQRDREAWRRWRGEHGEPSDEAAASPPAEIDDEPTPSRRGEAPPDVEDTEGTPTPKRPATGGREDDGADRRALELIAETVLKRDRLPPKAIKRLLKDADDEELSALVKDRRKAQADQDAMGSELAKLKGAGAKKPDDQEPAAEATEGADDAIKALGAHFRSVGDSKGAELWDKAVDALLKRVGPTPAEPRPTEASEEAQIERVLFEFRGPIADLAKTYPQLKGDAGQKRLVRMANRLLSERVFSDEEMNPDVVLGRAAEVLFPTDPKAARAKIIQRNQEQRDGQPSPESHSPGRDGGGISEEEADRRIYRMLQSGKYTPDDLAAWKRRNVRSAAQ